MATITLSKGIANLFCELLEDASQRYNNHGCNDLPERWTAELTEREQEEICSRVRDLQGDSDWPTDIECVQDFLLFDVLADMIKPKDVGTGDGT